MDWNAWVANHEHPAIAKRVFDWLQKYGADEAVWQMKDELVELLLETKAEPD